MGRGQITPHAIKDKIYDMGMTLLKGFNREECATVFHEYLKNHPENSFAHWVISYCHGADYNMYGKIYETIREDSNWPSIKIALKHSCLAVENQIDNNVWKVIYEASNIRFETKNLQLYASYLQKNLSSFTKNDPIIYAVEAESLMLLEPWNLWNQKSMQPTENARKVKKILDEGLYKFPNDEWLCHLKVHFCEMGPKDQFDFSVLPILEKSINGHLRHRF